jgi:hypothetical protein
MRTIILTAIALATLTATASAQGPAPAASGPQPVTDFSLVSTKIVISDSDGTAVKTLDCEWTVPEDDDMPCIRFQGDPQTAFEAIEEAGGVRADQETHHSRGDGRSAYSKRGDGTWLIRFSGTADGRPYHRGFVCTADGQKCVRWDAEGARSARRDVHAAAAKLRRKR